MNTLEALGPTGLTYIAWIVFIVAQIADIVTTRRALELPGSREANPLIAWLMRLTGDNWWRVKMAVAIMAAVLISRSGAPLVLLALGVITGLVAFRNYQVIRRHEDRS